MVAMAHGRECAIWRNLSRETRRAIELSIESLCLREWRKVCKEGLVPTAGAGIVAVAGGRCLKITVRFVYQARSGCAVVSGEEVACCWTQN